MRGEKIAKLQGSAKIKCRCANDSCRKSLPLIQFLTLFKNRAGEIESDRDGDEESNHEKEAHTNTNIN